MNKKIEDYLPYYIGQDIQIPAIEEGAKFDIMKLTYEKFKYDLSKVKLYLRPLSDMADDEIVEMMQQKHKYDTGNEFSHQITDAAYRIEWAIKKGFDVFNLIESGLAVDKTKEVK
ncbi:MAG: hypothetical protein IAE96_05025 [Chitinophagaceae bacterium]|nr:hypothetical protein [Chitinophagaceae bacterium]